MTIHEKLSLYQELISCSQSIYLWRFDQGGNLVESSCPQAQMLLPIFRHENCFAYVCSVEEQSPILMSNEVGLTWAASREWDNDELQSVYVIGPCFLDTFSAETLEQRIRGSFFLHPTSTRGWREKLAHELTHLPTISLLLINELAVMLHYCVTGRKCCIDDLHYRVPEKGAGVDCTPSRGEHIQSFRVEQALLQMVREGNPEVSGVHTQAQLASSIQPYTNDPIINSKIMCTIFTSLCAREAMKGGVSPSLAHTIGDNYIREVWASRNVSSIAAVNNQMYHDFIARVRKLRTSQQCSPAIKSCVDYIETHIEGTLNIDVLAARLGYTKYYLSRRFKSELGVSVNEFIKTVKIERAKVLLRTTTDSIDSIMARLGFTSRSYFSDTFKKVAGITATQYREENLSY